MAKSSRFNHLPPAYKELSQFVYKDLKVACIVRGIEFQDVVHGDHGSLASFFIKNYDKAQDPELLEDFDNWMDRQLELSGIAEDDPLRQFRLSSSLDPDTEDTKLRKRKLKGVKIPKKKRKKRERNSTFNVIKGTKKEFTMELVKKLMGLGKNMESKKLQATLVKKVVEKYPDANPKSVMIWYKRALNELKDKG